MSSSLTGASSGSLLLRDYSNFRGVDFSNYEVSLYRSPDALNMWKDYKNLGKCIQTRPDMEKLLSFNNTIFGLFFYTISQVEHMIIHCGVSLFDYNMKTKEMKTIKSIGMNPRKSMSFVFDGLFYIKDGINYLKYDGDTCTDVIGYIPTTTISRSPSGGGTTYEDVNLLSKYRKNSFCSDGKSTEYYLDAEQLTSSNIRVWINDVEKTTGFTVDSIKGKVTFSEVIPEPLTEGQDNVVIQYEKEIDGYSNRINKCTLLEVFDNRVFFSGNQDYPNTIFHSSLFDPTYCSDLDYYNEGLDLSPVKAMITGNNALWVIKEPSQSNTTVFYHNPTIDSELGKVYPSQHSSISIGCVATGINFNDDIVFFSDRGMEGISGDITTEQVVAHRSSLVDSKMLNEKGYKDLVLQEWEGYLLVIIKNKIYLADSRNLFTNQNHNEYEWFYWEFEHNIISANVKNNILYLCTEAEDIKDSNNFLKYSKDGEIYWYDKENNLMYDNVYTQLSEFEIDNYEKIQGSGIYTLTNNNANIESYWCTCKDYCKYPQMLKTTNKRGCTIDVTGEEIKVEVRTDKDEFEEIGTFINTKDYIVPRIKKKKWKEIQIKLSSNKPFGIERVYLEVYIGSYIKR